MIDYPATVVRNLLVYLPDIDAIKYRLTYSLTEDAFTASRQDDFYDEEHHTLYSRAPRTTRIPKNTNSRSELLSCMTIDLSVAMETVLTRDERTILTLKAYAEYEAEAKGELQPEHSSLYLDEDFQKIVEFLNRG